MFPNNTLQNPQFQNQQVAFNTQNPFLPMQPTLAQMQQASTAWQTIKNNQAMQKEMAVENLIGKHLSSYWEPLQPLQVNIPPLALCSAVPKDLGYFCNEMASAFGVLPGEVLLAVSGAIALAARGRFYVAVQPSWREAVALNICMLKASGTKKSSFLSVLKHPFLERQEQLHAVDSVHSSLVKREIVQQGNKLLRREIGKRCSAGALPEQIVAEFVARGAELEQLSKEASMPLHLLHTQCPNRIALEKEMSEGDGFFGICADEDPFPAQVKEKDRFPNLLLTGYDGGPYSYALQNQTFHVPSLAAVSMLVLAQNEVIMSYFKKSHLMGNGFLPRFLVCFMDNSSSLQGSRNNLSADVMQVYQEKIRQVLLRTTGANAPIERQAINFIPDARQHFNGFTCDQTNNSQRPMGWDAYLSKELGKTIRLAACLCLWRDPSATAPCIEKNDLQVAVNLMNGLGPHAWEAFGGNATEHRNNAMRILDCVRTHGQNVFTINDIGRWLNNMPKDKAMPAVDLLEQKKYLRKVMVSGRAVTCVMNPYFFRSVSPYFNQPW